MFPKIKNKRKYVTWMGIIFLVLLVLFTFLQLKYTSYFPSFLVKCHIPNGSKSIFNILILSIVATSFIHGLYFITLYETTGYYAHSQNDSLLRTSSYQGRNPTILSPFMLYVLLGIVCFVPFYLYHLITLKKETRNHTKRAKRSKEKHKEILDSPDIL